MCGPCQEAASGPMECLASDHVVPQQRRDVTTDCVFCVVRVESIQGKPVAKTRPDEIELVN
jgi:hypothetical protein